MARTLKDLDAAAELGTTLTQLRVERYPGPRTVSNGRMSRVIYAHYEREMSEEQIRKFHSGEVDPNVAPMEDVIALAWFYGVSPGDLHPILARRWSWVTGRIKDGDLDLTRSDEGFDASGCSHPGGRALYPDDYMFDDNWATPAASGPVVDVTDGAPHAQYERVA